ncbi:ABC transporter ATP-binding protein [Neobacillus sp. SuZ13]|uniref:ABC transporter ATP-binding protein n=1 Tax=Neobacillus sp. SuZ13 TaxID=3047875 RepID=UPI0024C0BBF4|nr:ABC transporter ATP-binding protein [Neobacillus sp. SuZ13]WHY68437.1 ABC transporter ATP-binding protein [Neobacillus sp. SuZ13]
MSIIEAVDVDKAFNGRDILKGVSFSIKEGSIIGLLGPNGAGKTTMIRLLNGVINATSGKMKVMGYDPQTEGDKIRKRAGIVTESAALYHDMSAWDNLVFFSKIYNAYDPKRITHLLEQFEMIEKKDQLVGTFSTGMKKRITLAKALLHKPALLFLDEPTNGLDPEGINDVIHYLKKVNKEEKVTIVICSHVLHQLETICDTFLFLKGGQIVEKGTRSELEDRYLTEVTLLVETGLLPIDHKTYRGFGYIRKDRHMIEFHLSSKNEIPGLLKSILSETWIHSCEITNRSLESLYFKIRGEKHE